MYGGHIAGIDKLVKHKDIYVRIFCNTQSFEFAKLLARHIHDGKNLEQEQIWHAYTYVRACSWLHLCCCFCALLKQSIIKVCQHCVPRVQRDGDSSFPKTEQVVARRSFKDVPDMRLGFSF